MTGPRSVSGSVPAFTLRALALSISVFSLENFVKDAIILKIPSTSLKSIFQGQKKLKSIFHTPASQESPNSQNSRFSVQPPQNYIKGWK